MEAVKGRESVINGTAEEKPLSVLNNLMIKEVV
jgi:hypothetical protein